MAASPSSESIADSGDWLDEIDLDPEKPWLRMGTRALGDRPWLVVDSRRDAELALKQQLLAERHGEVFAANSNTEAASQRVLDLVTAELAGRGIDPRPPGGHAGGRDFHPLDLAGRLVQEDLCLLRWEPEAWVLVAASLCFPSRWRLARKMGHPLTAVHGPVVGYAEQLAPKVDRLLDRLDGDRIVWRRNWFIHPDPALFQPDRPTGAEPVIDAAHCLDDLYLRSERQTLRRVDDPSPAGGRYVLFTIRIQHCPLAELAVGDRKVALIRFLDQASDELVAHHGVSSSQQAELMAALAR